MNEPARARSLWHAARPAPTPSDVHTRRPGVRTTPLPSSSVASTQRCPARRGPAGPTATPAPACAPPTPRTRTSERQERGDKVRRDPDGLRVPSACRARPSGRQRRFPARGCARRLSRVAASQQAQGLRLERDDLFGSSRARAPARYEVGLPIRISPPPCSPPADNLHPVAQRRRHRVGHVRGGDEEHPRQVERHVEVVVPECGVLLGVEDF